jgi:predicted membrane-bound spermidine synthase
MTANRRQLAILFTAFFFSGAAGLIYQVAWTRYLSLILGGSGAAHIIVLSTFMSGLGLGAWLIGRRADSTRSCLILFVALEFAIALYAVAFPWLFEAVRAAFLSSARGVPTGSTQLMVMKVIVAISLILLPTIMMGGTLPVLSKYLVDRMSTVGKRVAQLYYLNSFGAVVGCLLAGFWMVGQLGLTITMLIGAMFDMLVALVVFSQRDMPTAEESAAAEPEPEIAAPQEEAEIYPARIGLYTMIIICISGGVSMIYEVAWIRMLALIVGSSTYSYSLMVAAFIFGITLGSFLLSFKKTDRDYYPLLGNLQFLIGLSLLFSLPIYMQLPYTINQVQAVLQRTPEAFPLYQLMKFSLCFAVMIIPTVFIGMTLPVAGKVATRSLGTLGAQVGGVFGINTLGALFGAAIGGAILMPWLGLKGALLTGVLINVALGWVVVITAPPSPKLKNRKPVSVLIAANTIGGLLLANWTWNEKVLIISTFRTQEPYRSFEDYWTRVETPEVLSLVDGLDGSIAVIEWPEDKTVSLVINGKPDASVSPDLAKDPVDMPTQLLLGHIPMVFHPSPQRVAVVGQGSGVTAGAVALYPDVQLETIELSPEVAATAKYFAPGNRAFHEMENVDLIVEDARTHLALADEPYDLIINEPSNPWTVGNASLFTIEYFELCADRLTEDGLVLQWAHFYEMQDEALVMILRTMRQVFPYLSIWRIAHGDLAILGSTKPFEPDFRLMEERLQLPHVMEDLKAIGISDPRVFLNLQVFNVMESGTDFVGRGYLNSEYFPRLEFTAPLGFFLGDPAEVVFVLDQRARPEGKGTLWLPRYTPEMAIPELTTEQWQRAYVESRHRNVKYPDEPLAILTRWKEALPNDPWAPFYEITDNKQLPDAEQARLVRAPIFEPLWQEKEYRRRAFSIQEDYIRANEPMTDERAEHYKEMLAWYQNFVEEPSPDQWRFYYAQGMMLVQLERYREANAALKFAVFYSKQDTENFRQAWLSDIFRLLLICEIQMGNKENAEFLLPKFEKSGGGGAAAAVLRDQVSRMGN